MTQTIPPSGDVGHACQGHATLHPIDALLAEHEVILAVLEALERQAEAVRGGSALRKDLWALFPEFLRNFADRCHHGKEEQLLFPALVQRGLRDAGGPVGAMKHEHVLGRELVDVLESAIERGDAKDAAASAAGFVSLLRDHIAKENNVLFPIGRRLLEQPAVAELQHGFARVEREIMGAGTHCRYLALARHICALSAVEFERRRGDTLSGGCCGIH